MPKLPKDERALVAIDLGAESCRVSLLRWVPDGTSVTPSITLVHRFANGPRQTPDGLRWDLKMIQRGVQHGLTLCAAIAIEGIRSIAVDGWAVDYVYVDASGTALEDPFCYRDERTIRAEAALYKRISPERLRELTGVQLLRINTLCQLYADAEADRHVGTRWLTLPEYILSWLGGEQVAELTNATHTQMVGLEDGQWCGEIFQAAGLNIASAPRIVHPGTVIGKVRTGPLQHSAYRDTLLIAPGCHDTASAIAGIADADDDWAYISAGTWSLVGTLISSPINGAGAQTDNFTNLRAVGNRFCFHKSVSGMWLIQECIRHWAKEGVSWTVQGLVTAAQSLPPALAHLNLDDPEFMTAKNMPEKVNAQLRSRKLKPLDESASNGPEFANLIFRSLAQRYAEIITRVELHTGKELKRIIVVGGASQNEFLNVLTAEASGLEVIRGAVESSTIGNFGTQLAALEENRSTLGVSLNDVSTWATAIFGSRQSG